RASGVDVFLSVRRLRTTKHSRWHSGERLGLASGMAYSCAPSRQARRFPLPGLETGMGPMVLCAFVCAGLPAARRAPVPDLVTGSDHQSKSESDVRLSQ